MIVYCERDLISSVGLIEEGIWGTASAGHQSSAYLVPRQHHCMLRPTPPSLILLSTFYHFLMSGLEIAGVLLGSFPLIISGLEHWRDVAKVGGFFWRIRKEYNTCRREVRFYEILYKRNLKDLLLPIADDAVEVTCLISDPGGKGWSSKALQERLKGRLQESYDLYMEIIQEMNETAEELRKELAVDKATIQDKLALPEAKKQRRPSSLQPLSRPTKLESAKSKWDYETFRIKFSFNEPVRNELFEQLKEGNRRLEKLLSTSDKILALENIAPVNTKHTSALITAFQKVWKRSGLLFKAIQTAWQCSCQQYHIANLRLEHHTHAELCFEIIFMFVDPSSKANGPWSWRELQCGQVVSCSSPQNAVMPPIIPQSSQRLPSYTSAQTPLPGVAGRKKVAFVPPAQIVPEIVFDVPVNSTVELCQLLKNEEHSKCMGIIRHDNETYHLHPITRRKRPNRNVPLSLNCVLSEDFEGQLTRRQRYSVALLLASSVAQLQFTPWLNNTLTKEDVLFFPCEDDGCSVSYQEPFIRQGFPPQYPATLDTGAYDRDFVSLGILLLELCFGRRLEDHPLRKNHTDETGQSKQAFDHMAALKWCQGVRDEGGDDYASAVNWCFVTGAMNGNQSWRGEFIKNVIRPLEKCQEWFGTVSVL